MLQPLVLDPRPRRLTKLLHSIELKALGSREVTVEIPELDLRYIVPTGALIGRLLRENGMYEEHIVNWITSHIKPGGIFVDVGANLGWYSCLFAKLGRAFLYEPAPENVSLLKRNLALNNLTNYELFTAAVGAERSTKSLHLAHHSNPGAHTLVDGLYSEGDVSVPVITLDETIIPEICDSRISLLKMDVEGFELEALRGGSEVLSRTDAMVMEFNPSFLRRGGYDPSELWGLLGEFHAYRFRHDGDPAPTGEPDDTCDLLLLRQ